MKSFTLTTEDDCAIKRVMLADAMSWVLTEFDAKLREAEEGEEGSAQEFAEYWRDELRQYLDENCIQLGELYE